MIDESIKINDLKYFLKISRKNNNWEKWIFRGQNDYIEDLKTTIERSVNNFDIPYDNLPRLEQEIIRKFKRQYSHYSNKLPDDDDYIEWLSIMQHYGCPTRLLDFTYSIFIALFFAIRGVPRGRQATIFCIDANWLNRKYESKIANKEYKNEWGNDKLKRYKKLHKIILNNRKPFLYNVSPFYLNERLSIQQGTFIMPTDITKPFMENMNSTLIGKGNYKKIIKIKINCKKQFIYDTLNYLHRVNINESTLFSGLDGFSRHIKTLIVIPGSLFSDTEDFI